MVENNDQKDCRYSIFEQKKNKDLCRLLVANNNLWKYIRPTIFSGIKMFELQAGLSSAI